MKHIDLLFNAIILLINVSLAICNFKYYVYYRRNMKRLERIAKLELEYNLNYRK